MSFKKDGETKVYINKDRIGDKYANSEKSNRYTVDKLVKDSDEAENLPVTEDLSDKENDVSKQATI